MRIAIIGLPASGKTTVYRLLTHGQPRQQAGRMSEASIAVVRVPDPRLDRLVSLFKPKKVTPASMEFLDLAPLAKGSGKAGDAGGQLLPQMRSADALLAVLRAFRDERVPHIEGSIDTARDAATLEGELLLADLDVVEKRIAKIEEGLRKGKKEDTSQELVLLRLCREALENERPLREVSFSPEDDRLLRGFQFLTAKPLCFLLNVGENGGQAPTPPEAATATGGGSQTSIFSLPAKLELELAELPPDEASAFRAELGIDTSPVPRLLKLCYDLLRLITFFTAVGDELRAWTIPRGATASKAAATVHTDMERGFVKAEVIAFDALVRCGSLAGARKEGLLRLEGRDYLVADGDVITIRFNV
ncbi:MAG: redox-regulated ATPase YchF [candidate division NC10 bacterium]|nr:redox-regulated ATPase YchF [candidate division NC10 bacterium]